MKDKVTTTLTRYQTSFTGFTAGQKVVAIVGTGALLLAAFMVFRWATAPNYAPLYSNLSSKDASAVVDSLDAQGVQYTLAGNGGTIMVPQDQVYSTRIQLSGDGLPSQSDSRLLAAGQPEPVHQRVPGADRLQAGDGGRAVPHRRGARRRRHRRRPPGAPRQAGLLRPAGPADRLRAGRHPGRLHAVGRGGAGDRAPGRLQHRRHEPRRRDRRRRRGQRAHPGRHRGRHGQHPHPADRRLPGQHAGPHPDDARPAHRPRQLHRHRHRRPQLRQVGHPTRRSYSDNPKSPALSESRSSEKYTGPDAGSVGGVVGPDGQMDPTTTGGRPVEVHARTPRPPTTRSTPSSRTARPPPARSTRCTSASCSTPRSPRSRPARSRT